MTLRLVQLRLEDTRAVAALADDGSARLVEGAHSIRALAWDAIQAGKRLADMVTLGEAVDVAAALAEGRVLPPIDHPAIPRTCF